MAGKGIIEHKGRIDRIDGDTAYVKIQAETACLSCKLSSVCGEGTDEKTIEVEHIEKGYNVGDSVDVQITEKMGFIALFFGYLLPFMVVLLTLLLVNLATNKQGLSGLLALLSLIPYYGILALLKHKIKKSFQFKLHKRMQ